MYEFIILLFIILIFVYLYKFKLTTNIKLYYDEHFKLAPDLNIYIDSFGNLWVKYRDVDTKIVRSSSRVVGPPLPYEVKSINYKDFVIEKTFSRYMIIFGR